MARQRLVIPMRKITLICSTHNEHGRCTGEALLDILRIIRPQVAFVEVRPADFDAYKRGALPILESRVITRYRQFDPCQEVPVDRYEIRADLFPRMKAEVDEVINYVGQSSEEYRQLDEEHAKSMAEGGFGYLNSAGFAAREAMMSEIEDTTIARTRNPDAIRVLERWRQHHRSREAGMVASIYEHGKANAFDTGVFLVGAAHKTGIVREIGNRTSTEPPLIDWVFYGSQHH